MKFVVTRQRYWPDGEEVVEVAAGGIDYCNPDALAEKYAGEFEEFEDPRRAVEVAIEIKEAWEKDSKSPKELAFGSTYGMTIPFEPDSEENIKKYAEAVYARLPKCSQCGELLGGESFFHPDFPEEKFCSENCVEEYFACLE